MLHSRYRLLWHLGHLLQARKAFVEWWDKDGGLAALSSLRRYWSEKRGEGRVITEAKRTEVFERVDGRWRLSVGHAEVTPFAEGPSDR